ncbi:shikimate kinase [Nitzschia inconspicua]|uniref:Shikimate kinase n=1 Tax=Nitzschia inconspicua TaxID=303405 RepID=A0A9K3PI51_9STRA|nr:shikimate kinase [Nitzschia inconspicua]
MVVVLSTLFLFLITVGNNPDRSVSAFSLPTFTTTIATSAVKGTPFLSPSSSSLQSWQSSLLKRTTSKRRRTKRDTIAVCMAGGFEWEDPTETFDQGVENPFKNPELLKKKDSDDNDDTMKIDPARLLGPRLNGVNLYLIGMMGTGKSSVGDIVARRMGTYKFLDTDAIIEKATGMSIPEIFEQEGEDGFRTVESQVLDSVHSYVRCVVSTGGGLVTKAQNWGKLQSGIVVWLDVDPETIMERIQGTDRPLLQTEDPLRTLKQLLEERYPKYSQADVRIEITSDMDEEAVASKIIFELHNHIDENPPAWKLAQEKAKSEGLDWVK